MLTGSSLFRLRLICCGHDAGFYPDSGGVTYQEAHEFRESYCVVEGHVRQAIIEHLAQQEE